MARTAIQSDRSPKESFCLNAAVANGAGTALDVSNYDNILVMVACASATTTTATIKIQGTGKIDEPDWGSAQSVANHWDYLEIINQLDGTDILVGTTGIALSAVADAATVTQYVVNTQSMTWINAIMSGRTAGAVTVWFKPYKTS